MAPLPTSPYAADKLAGEYYLRVYHRVYDFAATALRYFNVYGPRQPANTPYAAVIPNFVKALAEGSPATIYGDGTQTRDFVHVADVVESNLLAASRTSGFGVFNIATGHATSIQQVFQLMAWHCPGAPKPVYAPQRKGEIVHSYAETAETVEHIGFRARIGLADGLAELLGSYCQSASR